MLARFLIPPLILLLAGCTIHGGPWAGDVGKANSGFVSLGRPPQAPFAQAGPSAAPVGFTSFGSGRFTQTAAVASEERTASGEPGVTLNLVNVSIAQAAKTVLGDLLGLNFIVDDRVQGSVTVQTTSPVSKAALVDIFEIVLRSRGAAIVDDAGFSRIVPIADARPRLPSAADSGAEIRPGLAIQIVPLEYVAAEEMRGILEPIAPTGGILRVDPTRNLIVIAGTASELASIRETIALFDVDWMRGMSFALHPLKRSEPEAVVQELEAIFQTSAGATGQMLRFLANTRLNAVLVIASKPRYLQEAQVWIERLDRAANARANSLVVYSTRNRRPSDLAPIVRQVFGVGGQPTAPSGVVAPLLQPVQIETASGDLTVAPDLVAAPAFEPAGMADIGAVDAVPGTMSIVPDDANGSLVVYASAEQHERIAALLAQIDRMPMQVMLEATIAEVSLNDELQFGLRWFFENGRFSGAFTDGGSFGIVPGFSFLFAGSNLQVALTALASVTDVKIVSSPTLMVLDNEEASLQVGDQVPTVTQTAQSVTDPAAPIVNSVQLRDTGVILRVRPHVNESGRVVLAIEQEVSDVVATTTSGIDSPTIRQRKIATTVVVGDGESLALGGLIQDRNAQTRSKVPVVGDIPLLRTLFRQKRDVVDRTELIVFIRPRVVFDVEEARRVTDEYRSQLTIRPPEDRNPVDIMRNDLSRELN